MTGWIIALTAAAAIWLLLVKVAGLTRSVWPVAGAALAVGLAGYAWQGNPDLAGSPRAAGERQIVFDEQMAKARQDLSDAYGPAAKWMTMSDGFARGGDSEAAANILQSALKDQPNSPGLWVGLGNALIGHAGGMATPASDYAYKQALRLAPNDPGAQFFYGLSLARAGELQKAKAQWSPLLTAIPENNPLYALIVRNLKQIEIIEAARSAKAVVQSEPMAP